MRDDGKKNVLGIGVSAIDYAGAIERIVEAALKKRALSVTALAVHGVMTGVLDREHRYRLNRFDIVTPDGQPVRWALNLLYRCGLERRVYGPDLVLKLCDRLAAEGLSVFLYGSRPEVLDALEAGLTARQPALKVAGRRPSLFRQTTPDEKAAIVGEIDASGASVVLVGLGCPRQEIFVYEYAASLSRPTLAVGAAFDFHAGLLRQAPAFLQDRGLEWLYRLVQEPRRLWRRYVLLNPAYATLLAAQRLGLMPFADAGQPPRSDVGHG